MTLGHCVVDADLHIEFFPLQAGVLRALASPAADGR